MHTVLNEKDNSEIKVEDGETIYEGFLKEGFDLPHGCLAGSCGACLIEITETTKESLNEPKTIEKDTLESIYQNRGIPRDRTLRLACRARVHGNFKFNFINYTSKEQS